jgi:hypothetical protein
MMTSAGRVLLFLSASIAATPALAAPPTVKLVTHEADHRVEVLVGDKPFTVYRWDEALKKPLLFPILTGNGAPVTRGFPLEPKEGDSKDHPHHIGLWFNHGDVDGVDFWNNSPTKTDKSKFGSIVHKAITSSGGGPGRGELNVTSEWVMPDGRAALSEQTHFVFGAAEGRRSIDRIASLKALGAPVAFNDNKEGMIGARLARSLEANGKKNPEGTGVYTSSEGKTGDAVWGTRARWVMLTGKVDGAPVTLAMLDHPKNPGFPTHWHARGYGLFAANPVGQKSIGKAEQPFTFTVAKGDTARFAYRFLILSRDAPAKDIEAEYQRFIKEVK